jgi:hypothetical protein
MPTGQPPEFVKQKMHSLVSSKSRARPCSGTAASARGMSLRSEQW